jgi:hypothetical protein
MRVFICVNIRIESIFDCFHLGMKNSWTSGFTHFKQTKVTVFHTQMKTVKHRLNPLVDGTFSVCHSGLSCSVYVTVD